MKNSSSETSLLEVTISGVITWFTFFVDRSSSVYFLTSQTHLIRCVFGVFFLTNRGESEGKSVGKKNGKISHHNQTGAKAVEMEINSGTSHQQQQHEQDSGDHEVTHNNTEHEAVQQGNGSSSVHVSGSPSVSDSSVHVHDSLPYGVACPVHPVQQLFADMAQLSLHVSSGALQQQIRHHEQKQRVQTHAESDVDDDDALLRDAVDAGQISNNQTVERHETQDVVSLEQRSNVRHIENGIDGSVNGQIHR